VTQAAPRSCAILLMAADNRCATAWSATGPHIILADRPSPLAFDTIGLQHALTRNVAKRFLVGCEKFLDRELPRKFFLNAPTAKLPHPHPLLGMIKQPLYFFSKISHVVRAIAVYGCFLCAESAFSPFELHNRLPKSHVFHD